MPVIYLYLETGNVCTSISYVHPFHWVDTQVSVHPNLMLDKYYINYICDGNTMEMECNTMETRVGQRQLIQKDTCPLYYGIFI